MAKKKTGHHSKGSHKRKRIGAAGSGKGLIEMLAGAAGGVILGDIINGQFGKTAPAYVTPAVLTVGGIAIAYVGANNAFVRGFGLGTFGAGVVGVGQDSGALQGIAGMLNGTGSSATALPRRVNGFRDVAAVGNFPKPNSVGRTVEMMGRLYKGVY